MLPTILLVLNTILVTALLVRELTRRKDVDSVERLVREEWPTTVVNPPKVSTRSPTSF